jgi:hypothetical protein
MTTLKQQLYIKSLAALWKWDFRIQCHLIDYGLVFSKLLSLYEVVPWTIYVAYIEVAKDPYDPMLADLFQNIKYARMEIIFDFKNKNGCIQSSMEFIDAVSPREMNPIFMGSA